ncbi:nucleopolyhedrovirus P10 family protein [Streptomyces sp. NBC_01304]|uniref:nucleopolyhedrovirus P10 family protein n=1 Tax=Streptomyces sp. NBC_01304 TaxID=2903818 RepID=UPI002E119F0A|nr:nucleopolyhedrovirus P10 family protein [Streptomyces sp. NBC_01304]
MTADGWVREVRRSLGLGRLLPLGDARDGAWITEHAARAVLSAAASGVRGVRLGPLRLGLADPAETGEPAVPPPPSALPPGALRIEADFEAIATTPLPTTADRLRAQLWECATTQLGLAVSAVDLRVTGLLDHEPEPDDVQRKPPASAGRAPRPGTDEARAAAAARSVLGVAGLTEDLGRAVHIEQRDTPPGAAALAGRHVRIELAVRTGYRAVDVALSVRREVSRELPGLPSVAVLVTRIGP